MSRQTSGHAGGELDLDGEDLTLREVCVDGERLRSGDYSANPHGLKIDLGDRRAAVVETTSVVLPGDPHNLGIARTPGTLSSVLEPTGLRHVTFCMDNPSVRSTYTVTLVADPAEYPDTFANGQLVSQASLPDGRVSRTFDDPIPKPSYLVSVLAGKFATQAVTVEAASDKLVELAVIAAPESIDGAGFALETLEQTMKFDLGIGGIPYDLDRLLMAAVARHPEATEYHGLMFFEPSLLILDSKGWTDDDVVPIVANVSHEYLHHTRGNRVTVTSWEQLALKEGLTVLAQGDFRAHLEGPAARIDEVAFLRRVQFPEEAVLAVPAVPSKLSDARKAYNRTSYLKAAEAFRMLRRVAGTGAWGQATSTFYNPDGTPCEVDLNGVRSTSHNVLLRDRSVVLEVATRPDVIVSALRDFSAPIDFHMDHTPEELGVLVVYETDVYARWSAAHELKLTAVDAFRSGNESLARQATAVLAGALGEIIARNDDPAVLARLLQIPSEVELGERSVTVDVDGIHRGVTAFAGLLGQSLGPVLAAVVRKGGDDPASTDAQDRAIRSLADSATALLLARGSVDDWELATNAVVNADPTRALRALARALGSGHPGSEELISLSERRWDGAPRLLDRCTRAQTGAARPETVARLRRLLSQPRYDRADRTRVMAVWFPFCTENRVAFHDISGSGYEVFVDELEFLIKVNPGLVPRLVPDFLQMHRFDATRQKMMREQLARVRSFDGLDASVGRIIDRLLESP
ncbi:MAG: aminopeptidase N C-terminal domain-containing protein [Acidimicrobiales bacterium]